MPFDWQNVLVINYGDSLDQGSFPDKSLYCYWAGENGLCIPVSLLYRCIQGSLYQGSNVLFLTKTLSFL